ncbi:MAG: hypothetical protein IIZ73_03520 [Ruminococcus sp.]|nr:hypothetical protein [Ruminococcus sp.]
MNHSSAAGYNEKLYDALLKILDKQLTQTQKCYIIMYYKERMTMREIAELRCVRPSTVCRTIKRADRKLEQLKTAAELIIGGQSAVSGE